jgi:regulator of protease activity HflC (stomatin/prohibitin superfamily)
LAQTTVRSEIGKIELDRTFEERPLINAHIVSEIDKASAAWGIKVLRYEIKNITPPDDLRAAMEKQMLAERQKRAAILISEGERTAAINASEGERAAAINASEGTRQAMINNAEGEKERKIREAEGQAAAITAVANATADGIRAVAQALQSPGGLEALQFRLADQYISQFGLLAKETNTMILPTNLADVAAVLATAMSVIKRNETDGGAPRSTPSAAIPTTSLPRS